MGLLDGSQEPRIPDHSSGSSCTFHSNQNSWNYNRMNCEEFLLYYKTPPSQWQVHIQQSYMTFNVKIFHWIMMSFPGSAALAAGCDREALHELSRFRGLCHSPLPFFQKYPEHAIYKVLQLMMRRGEIQHRLQRKVLYRIK